MFWFLRLFLDLDEIRLPDGNKLPRGIRVEMI
jgi:hypothetical protein